MIPPLNDDQCAQLEQMVAEQIVARGIRDPRLLAVLRKIPRSQFVPHDDQIRAYEDRALPIGHDQTVSQPFMVAYMTEQLTLEPRHRVLEIGTGSGYQTTILAGLADCVATVERIEVLHHRAAERLAAMQIRNVSFHLGDGSVGLPRLAPFDRILVTAAAPSVPPALVEQLGPEGRLIAPIGGAQEQTITRVERRDGREIRTPLLQCRFVKLIGDQGWEC